MLAASFCAPRVCFWVWAGVLTVGKIATVGQFFALAAVGKVSTFNCHGAVTAVRTLAKARDNSGAPSRRSRGSLLTRAPIFPTGSLGDPNATEGPAALFAGCRRSRPSFGGARLNRAHTAFPTVNTLPPSPCLGRRRPLRGDNPTNATHSSADKQECRVHYRVCIYYNKPMTRSLWKGPFSEALKYCPGDAGTKLNKKNSLSDSVLGAPRSVNNHKTKTFV